MRDGREAPRMLPRAGRGKAAGCFYFSIGCVGGIVTEQQPGETSSKGCGDLGLDPKLVATVGELGYEEATPIQREAIPAVLTGKDVIGQAATGTGKTAAFALP